jgi:hypothetical protein
VLTIIVAVIMAVAAAATSAVRNFLAVTSLQ